MSVNSNVVLNNLPPWYENFSRNALERGQAISNAPYQPYRGLRVAGQTPDTRRADVLGRREGIYAPYFNQAQSNYETASRPFYQDYNNYLNPYMQSVLDRQRTEGLRTFNEGIMPALDSRFIQGGHYAGGMHRGLAERAARDVQQSIGDRQQQALASNYQQAAQMHASDRDRQLQAGARMQNLGQQAQAGNIADIATLESQGERQRALQQQGLDVGYRDFLRQSEYPQAQLSILSNAIAGAPHQSQGLQYMQSPGEPQLNRVGQMGQLAGQLYGLNRFSGGNAFKDGGTVEKHGIPKRFSKKVKVKEGLPFHSGLPKRKRKKKEVR